MTGPSQGLLDLYILTRNVMWRYRLDQYEQEALRHIQDTIEKARLEVVKRFHQHWKQTEWRSDRDEQIINWLEHTSLAIRETLTHQIADIAGAAAEHSLAEHEAIVSLDGHVPKFNHVELTPGQMQQFFLDTPLGGGTLTTWVDRSFDAAVTAGMREELNTGVLQGEGYPKLIKRFQDGFQQLSRREAVTLTRTYVQTANVAASQAVYAANRDIVQKWRWCATMENGYSKSGHGTCLVCAALDGQEFKLNDGPEIPRHPNCRCVALPVMVFWRDLGIPLDEMEDAVRPYTIRPDQAVDTGGKRTIQEVGFHHGDYASWFAKQSEKHQLEALGPKRFELYKAGKIEFKDLIDKQGNLRNLDNLIEKKGKITPKEPTKPTKTNQRRN